MNVPMFYISQSGFFTFLEDLRSDYEVFVPVKKGQQRFYEKYTAPREDIVFGEVRAFEPLKAFFSHARELVAKGFEDTVPPTGKKPFAIVGVKACDLKGFLVQNFVFQNHGCPDPFYLRNRNNNLIISADCTCAIHTCFCLALGIVPHPESNFDLNLSVVPGGFVVQVGSQKGQNLVDRNAVLFKPASPEVLRDREATRKNVMVAVGANIEALSIPSQDQFEGIIERNFNSGIWEDEAKTCVECGACNTICPTCHCFLLYDQKDEKAMARLRLWDSCLLKDFARVAGGANPRVKLWMRLRNRFEKKFDFFPKVAKVYACTGCGRCVSACPAKIDIREVLKRLVKNVVS